MAWKSTTWWYEFARVSVSQTERGADHCVGIRREALGYGAARTSREGISFPIHVSMSPCRTSYRGEMTPHLFNLRMRKPEFGIIASRRYIRLPAGCSLQQCSNSDICAGRSGCQAAWRSLRG